MPYRKALVNSSTPKMTQKEYNMQMEQFYKELPFHKIRGRKNPYTGTLVETWHDYMLYGHCYVMKQLTESELSSLETQYQNSITNLEANNIRLSKDLQISRRKRKLLSIFSVLLSLLCVILLLSPNPLEDDLAALKKEIYELQNNLLLAEAAIDQSYRDGLSAGYRLNQPDDPPIERPSYSFNHSYDDSPAVETYYIGNSSTKKFHRSSCSYLPSQQNQVALSSREEAISSGYNPCQRCDP